MPIFQKMRTVFGLGGEQFPPSAAIIASRPPSPGSLEPDIHWQDIGDWTALARSFGRRRLSAGPRLPQRLLGGGSCRCQRWASGQAASQRLWSRDAGLHSPWRTHLPLGRPQSRLDRSGAGQCLRHGRACCLQCAGAAASGLAADRGRPGRIAQHLRLARSRGPAYRAAALRAKLCKPSKSLKRSPWSAMILTPIGAWICPAADIASMAVSTSE